MESENPQPAGGDSRQRRFAASRLRRRTPDAQATVAPAPETAPVEPAPAGAAGEWIESAETDAGTADAFGEALGRPRVRVIGCSPGCLLLSLLVSLALTLVLNLIL